MRLDRRRRDDSLGRAADAPQQIHRRVVADREHRRRHVAVQDQPNAGAGVADLAHRIVVSLAVEHHDHHVADVDVLALGDQLERLAAAAGRGRAGRRSRGRRPSSPCTRTDPGRTSRPARRARSPRSRSASRARSAASPRADRRRCRPSAGLPSPICSPLNSIGASSFSPSPITTTPSIDTVSSTLRIASTAAWSAPSLSPRPTMRAAASAAASVTRTSSSARLRSGRRWPLTVLTAPPVACARPRSRASASDPSGSQHAAQLQHSPWPARRVPSPRSRSLNCIGAACRSGRTRSQLLGSSRPDGLSPATARAGPRRGGVAA